MKQAWKKSAATEAGKKSLAAACKTAMAATRKSMAAYNCEL
jgi:hypothetical protein